MNSCAIHILKDVEILAGQRPRKGWVINDVIRERTGSLACLQVDKKSLREVSGLPKVMHPLCRRIGYTRTFHKCQVLLSSQVSSVPFLSIKSVYT